MGGGSCNHQDTETRRKHEGSSGSYWQISLTRAKRGVQKWRPPETTQSRLRSGLWRIRRFPAAPFLNASRQRRDGQALYLASWHPGILAVILLCVLCVLCGSIPFLTTSPMVTFVSILQPAAKMKLLLRGPLCLRALVVAAQVSFSSRFDGWFQADCRHRMV